MPIETHVDHARTRVAAERETMTAKLEGIDAFRDRLGDAPTHDAPRPGAGVTGGGGVQTLAAGSGSDGCRTVRRAFAETVRPHSDVAEDATLLEAVRTELTDAIAAALAPKTAATLTPTLVRAIDAEAAARRRETELTIDVLAAEDASLADAESTVAAVTDWIVTADQTPLSELGFDALRDRHETLAAHRERCEHLAADRQAFLRDVTSYDGALALRHRDLLAHVYEDFPVEHPVLATVARLDEACVACQRAVRDHLVRRA